MKKQVFVSSCVLVLCISALAFAQNSIFTNYLLGAAAEGGQTEAVLNPAIESDRKANQIVEKDETISKTDNAAVPNLSKEPLSDEAAFELFFVKVISLERAAAKAEAQGKSAKLWRNYLSNQGFTDEEAAVLRQIAKEFAAEIVPLHTKALQIIKTGRAAIAQGKPLETPPVLAELQKQRNALVTRYKNRLQNQLGGATVEKIKLLMQKNSSASQINPENLMNSEERRTLFKERINKSKGGQQ